MGRLDQAKLLEKVSGYRRGEDGENIPNHYILSDPIQELDEFLAVARAGHFARSLREDWQDYGVDPCIENQYTPYRTSIQPPVAEINTYKQTSLLEQVDQENTFLSDLWRGVLDTLKHQLPTATYYGFIDGTKLVALEGTTATIELEAAMKDWVENRLSIQLKQLLTIEGKPADKDFQVDTLEFSVVKKNL